MKMNAGKQFLNDIPVTFDTLYHDLLFSLSLSVFLSFTLSLSPSLSRSVQLSQQFPDICSFKVLFLRETTMNYLRFWQHVSGKNGLWKL